MRFYNVYHCPGCKHFECRAIPVRKWVCKAGKREEEIIIDPGMDNSIIDPPPACSDFILEGRK